jgi:hypothetical protein
MFSALKNGYEAEERFVLECLKKDIPISRPIYNVEPYDFVVESCGVMYRVQVKRSWVDDKGRNMVCLKSSYPRSNKSNIVGQNDRVDFVAVLVSDDWYIVPRDAIQQIKSQASFSCSGKYGKYINNFAFCQ